MKHIGIDYGRRRIGVAISDETGTLVRSLMVIDRQKEKNPLGVLATAITNEKVEVIVFGVPLGPHDEETEMSREVRTFAAKLAETVPLPVQFIDESLTSRRAEELLMFRSKKERRNKSSSDRIASCLILERYLEDRPL